ncbi:DUF6924 domain-containing protein [Streptomyces sp. NPDC049040]|uniref:DUF6924 domain-containing protein n=1 Tax=Streptomyces sp. NPDC049040 TaxID=3365593 RepID=UPI00371BF2F2
MLIIRTDFSDETAWQAVCEESLRPWGDGDYEPHVHLVDDPVWAGATTDHVIAAVSADEDLSIVFLADRITMRNREHPLLAVAVLTRDECASDEEFEAYGGSLRTACASIHDIHANLSIANLDFADLAEAARNDPAGIFRSF